MDRSIESMLGELGTVFDLEIGTESDAGSIIGRSAPDGVVAKFTEEWLEHALLHHRASYPRVRMARRGAPIPLHEYVGVSGPVFPGDPASVDSWIDRRRSLEQLEAEGSLTWDWLEEVDVELAERSAEAASLAGHQVVTSLYASTGTTSAFGLHADSMDILVVQVVGGKRWVFPNSDRSIVIEEGDVLWIPRGMPHEVSSIGVRSHHLSISFIAPSVSMFLRWLATRPGMESPLQDVDLARLCSQHLLQFRNKFPSMRPFFQW